MLRCFRLFACCRRRTSSRRSLLHRLIAAQPSSPGLPLLRHHGYQVQAVNYMLNREVLYETSQLHKAAERRRERSEQLLEKGADDA